MTIRFRSVVVTVFVIALLVGLSGCSTALVDERIAYWSTSAKESLPPGTTLQEAKNFFASKGLELRCCVSGPDITDAYFTSERKVGRNFFVEYDVAIIVDITQDQRVERIRVQRWGVGL